jgi:glycosyltransferase involved in cell wall biosynthesis
VKALGGRLIPLKLSRNLWRFSRDFRRLLRDGRYDVVHAHPHHFCGYLLRLAGKEGVPRRIAHSHTSYDGRGSAPARTAYRWLMKRWIRIYATHCLAVSQTAAAGLYGRRCRCDPRFSIVRCGIDLEAYRRAADRPAVREELGIPADAPVVGHVGRFTAAKNHEGLVAIAEIVLRSESEAHFVLVGDGPLRADIEAIVRRQGMSDRFLFLGARSDVPRLLAAMDVFLFPSRWEGLGIVLVEAQAAGVPVVASDIPGIREGVAPDPLNHLFALDAWEQAAEEVIRRLRLPSASRQEPSPAIAAFLAPFDIKRSARELEEIYEPAPRAVVRSRSASQATPDTG